MTCMTLSILKFEVLFQQCYILRLVIYEGCFTGEDLEMVLMELINDHISLLLCLLLLSAHKMFHMQYHGHMKRCVAASTEVMAIIAGLFKDALQQG